MYQELAAHFRGLGSAGIDLLTEFVFPPTCAGCNSAGSWLCAMCSERLVDLDGPGTREPTGTDFSPFELHARFVYVEPVRRAIHLLKYERQRARSEWFASQLEPLVAPLIDGHSVLQPVPLTSRRQRDRGFNQSTEIARHLSKRLGIPMRDDLSRTRETRPQVELSGLERVANVRGAFRADAQFDGCRVLLVDDVITTGATMRECASACFEAGAESVVGLAIARGLN